MRERYEWGWGDIHTPDTLNEVYKTAFTGVAGLLGNREPRGVLSLGCGYGREIEAMRNVWPRVSVVGVSMGELPVLRKGVRLYLDRIRNFPFDLDASQFDIVTLCNVASRDVDGRLASGIHASLLPLDGVLVTSGDTDTRVFEPKFTPQEVGCNFYGLWLSPFDRFRLWRPKHENRLR